MFGYRGRIGRIWFWLGLMTTTAIAGFLASIVAGTFDGVGEFGRFLSVAAIVGLVVWMTSAVTVKRLHDRNRSGWWYLLYGIVPPGCFLLAISANSEGDFEAASIFYVLSVVALFWVVIELGLMRGTRGDNRFGSEPV
jgi:uncharacterized membrane protein YhaH (DUF805 family)